MKKTILLKSLLLLCALIVGSSTMWGTTNSLTFAQTSSSAGTLSGTVPDGVSATFSNTYSTKDQVTSGNTMTLTLSGWDPTTTITGVKLNVRNNKSSGSGTATVKVGNTTIGTLDITGLGNTYQEKTVSITSTMATENLVIIISCSTSSAFCNNFKVEYEEDTRINIATINSLTPTSLDLGSDGTFSADITPAEGKTSSDYTVSYSTTSGDEVLLIDGNEYVVGSTKAKAKVTVTVTPTAGNLTTHKPVSRKFDVKLYDFSANDGSVSKPFTVAEARAFQSTPDVFYDEDEYYYVQGWVEKKGSISSGHISYYISDDCTDTNPIYVYRGIKASGTNFDSDADLELEDNVVVYGKLGTRSVSATTYVALSEESYITTLSRRESAGLSFTDEQLNAYPGQTPFTPSTLNNPNEVTVSYSTSNDAIADVNASTGAITIGTTEGTATITATYTGTVTPSVSTYKTTTATYKVKVAKLNIATLGTLNKTALNTGEAGSFSTTITPADPGMTEGVDYTKEWTCSPAEGLLTSDAGAYSATARGTYTVTLAITPDDDVKYKTTSKNYTVKVSTPVIVTASDVEMDYDAGTEDIGATVSTGYAGTLGYVSANTNIATVSASGVVTAVSAGTTTITISAPADAENLYTAGEDVVINVTVNAPAGGTETPASGAAVELYSCLATGGSGLPNGWTPDASDMWHYESSYGAVAGSSTSGNGTEGTNYDLITEDFDLSGYYKPFVYFQHVANKVSTKKTTVCKLFVQEGTNDPVQLTISNWFNGSNWTFVNSGNIDLSAYTEKTVHFIFRYTPSGTNANGKWEVKDFKIKAYNFPTENITVASSGFSTHCYQYPLDLDKLDEDVKAYIVTNVSGANVTFKRITGTIKGGVPFILYGTTEEHTLTTAASSTTVPENNLLVGTLSPTYITATDGDYTNFGMKSGKFVKAANGVIGANKAYLHVLTSALAGAHELGITFEDENATGITSISHKTIGNECYYNLNGQRVDASHKGIVIVNGKKFYNK